MRKKEEVNPLPSLEEKAIKNLVKIPDNPPPGIRAINGMPELQLDEILAGNITCDGFDPNAVITYSKRVDSGKLDYEDELVTEHREFMSKVDKIKSWFNDDEVFTSISPYSNLDKDLKKEILAICGNTYAIFSGTYAMVTRSTPRYERNSFSGRMDGAIISCCVHIMRSTLSRSQLVNELKQADIYIGEALAIMIAMYLKGYCSLEQFFQITGRMRAVKIRIGNVIKNFLNTSI